MAAKQSRRLDPVRLGQPVFFDECALHQLTVFEPMPGAGSLQAGVVNLYSLIQILLRVMLVGPGKHDGAWIDFPGVTGDAIGIEQHFSIATSYVHPDSPMPRSYWLRFWQRRPLLNLSTQPTRSVRTGPLTGDTSTQYLK